MERIKHIFVQANGIPNTEMERKKKKESKDHKKFENSRKCNKEISKPSH
jgi:hypothetical protein